VRKNRFDKLHLSKLRKEILFINREINNTRHIIDGLLRFRYKKMNRSTLKDKSREELIKMLSMIRSLRMEYKTKLIESRLQIMSLLIKSRKLLVENFLFRESVPNNRTFSHVCYKSLISGSRVYNRKIIKR